MVRDGAFEQLLEMGIPGGRARAALRRTNGDAMSAAERVFGGDFDNIPSDDEGIIVGTKGSTGLCTPEEMPDPSTAEKRRAQRGEEGIEGEDGDEGDEEGDVDMDHFVDENDDTAGERLLSDPYGGVFFTKDRVEKIVEPVEEVRYARLLTPKGELESVRVLSRGEWMSGCSEGNEQSLLFQLYSILEETQVPCTTSGCGQTLPRNKDDFLALWKPDFPSYTAHLSKVIHHTCQKCHLTTCLACGENVRESTKGKASAQKKVKDELDVLLHCLNIQGVIIGVGLHMIEQAFSQIRKRNAPSRDTVVSSKKRKADASPDNSKPNSFSNAMSTKLLGLPHSTPKFVPSEEITEDLDDIDWDDDSDDDPSGMGSSKGIGYAGVKYEDRSGQAAAAKAQQQADVGTATLLSQVRVYLPTMNRASGPRTSDYMVHPTTLTHLRRRSGFVNDLLRNDSLLDMSNRGDLYCALLDWLEVISNHEALASILAMPHMRAVRSEDASMGPNEPPQKLVTYEGAPSPRELLESCVIQAEAALKGLNATTAKLQDRPMTEDEMCLSVAEVAQKDLEKKEEQLQDGTFNLMTFCERILKSANKIDRSLTDTKGQVFVARMRESLPRLPDVGTKVEQTAGGDTDEAIVKIYEEWAGRARFQYCDMSQTTESGQTYRHAYSSELKQIANIDAPKRSLAIAKELAILTRNLPVAYHSSIFLRVDETRVDCLKAMIIGPEGTPYENGCFVFDIFLPLNYNFKCPEVLSRTTNGGRYRYNPNLYADGKVCLSLLGTWSGPGWIAGQSTLLQVLISIQSLILCEEPYCNEPGWAADSGTAASKAYSANVRRMTMIDAMANNIKTPPVCFESETKTHFRLKVKTIRKQLDRWKTLDDGKKARDDHYGVGGGSFDPVFEGLQNTKGNDSNAASGTSATPFDKAAAALRMLLEELEDKTPESPSTAAEGSSELAEGLSKAVGMTLRSGKDKEQR